MSRRSFLRPAWPLIICLAIALLWPTSKVWTGWIVVGAMSHRVAVEIGPGWLGLTFGPVKTGSAYTSRTAKPPAINIHRLTGDDSRLLSFPQIFSYPGEYRFYSPLWMVTIGTLIFASGLLASRVRRAMQFKPGHCPHCGYDLRASPDRCPECGRSPVPR